MVYVDAKDRVSGVSDGGEDRGSEHVRIPVRRLDRPVKQYKRTVYGTVRCDGVARLGRKTWESAKSFT
jgi:hypothetical protein